MSLKLWEARGDKNLLVAQYHSLQGVVAITKCTKPVKLERSLYAARTPEGMLLIIRRER